MQNNAKQCKTMQNKNATLGNCHFLAQKVSENGSMYFSPNKNSGMLSFLKMEIINLNAVLWQGK